MGHFRLGTLPDTRPWQTVIEHLADGQAACVVAQATTHAIEATLLQAATDRGLARIVWMLARTLEASRADDFVNELSPLVPLPPQPTLLDLTVGFSQGLDDWFRRRRLLRSDFADLAELAAEESLTRCLAPRSQTLLDRSPPIQPAVRTLATPKGFAVLAHEYYTRFTQRVLHYHLDRELSAHVGGAGRFPDRAARREFEGDLEIHCREAARITRDYAHDWFSKSRYETQLSEPDARTFSRVCMTKLRAELLVRGQHHG